MFRKQLQIAVLMSGIALPMLMGQGCPVAETGGTGTGSGTGTGGAVQAAQPETLLSNTKTTIGAVFTYVGSFNPNAVGKVITVSVSGNTTGSRPKVIVYDNLGNKVADEEVPVTNVTTVSFSSSSTGMYYIYAAEAGTPASLYTITAVQQP